MKTNVNGERLYKKKVSGIIGMPDLTSVFQTNDRLYYNSILGVQYYGFYSRYCCYIIGRLVLCYSGPH